MGKVFVVGIGPGNFENMTIRADRALCACDAIVGYPVYVDLVKDRYPGKALYQTPMTKEVARCQLALDLAREGKTVCLVCSGDSGIYGMAALVFELRGATPEPSRTPFACTAVPARRVLNAGPRWRAAASRAGPPCFARTVSEPDIRSYNPFT